MTHIKTKLSPQGSPSEGHGEDNPKQQCQDRGGKWDEARQFCILPSEKEKQRVFRDAPTSQGRGFALPAETDPELAAQQAGARTAKDKLIAKQDLVRKTLAKDEETPEEIGLGFAAEDITQIIDGVETIIVPKGTKITAQQAALLGLTTDSSALQQADFQAGLIVEGAAASSGIGKAATATGITSKATNFLNKFKRTTQVAKVVSKTKGAAPGSRALGTNPRALGTNPRSLGPNPKPTTAVLKAPSKLKALIGVGAGAGIAFFGLSKVISITTEALVGDAKKIKSDASQLGEVLTKIAETTNHGFQIEDGQVVEYTHKMGLADVDDVEQILLASRRKLQQNSIDNAFLKFNHEHRQAVQEVEKQLTETDTAESKILAQLVNPSPAHLASVEFWRDFDLEG